MTDQDTSPEAVERLADSYVIPGMPEDCRPVIVAATLRALSAALEDERGKAGKLAFNLGAMTSRAETAETERDTLKDDLEFMKASRKGWMDAAQSARAERDALKAELAEAVERLRFYASHSNWEQMFAINADGLAHQSLGSPIDCDNGNKARAFLARHQKEVDT